MIGSIRYTYIPPEDIEVKRAQNSQEEWFSILGSPSQYKIVVNPTPSAGLPISYPYYRSINMPETTLDIVEISRPLFCVYYILRQLYFDDVVNKDLAEMYDQKMDEQERREKVALARTPSGTPNKIRLTFGSGFGVTSRNR